MLVIYLMFFRIYESIEHKIKTKKFIEQGFKRDCSFIFSILRAYLKICEKD